MRKELKEKLRKDPIRYEIYLQRNREYRKRKLKRIKLDPILYERLKQKSKESNLKNAEKYRLKRLEKRRVVLEKRNKSPYWRVKGYYRYKHHTFKFLSNRVNLRCKNGKIDALDLWSIAKKQRLICPLTGEKLTVSNISVDHIFPKSKGGTNDKNNLRLVTFAANSAKNSMTDDEFIKFCQRVVDYNKRKK